MKKIASFFIIIILVFSSIPFQINVKAESNTKQPIITVKLVNYLGNLKELTINFTGKYILNNDFTIESGKTYKIKNENGKLVLLEGTKTINTLSEVVFIPSIYDEQHFIHINNRPYLGTIRFVPEGNFIKPINILPMEDYLKGVVPSEMPASWNVEALKSQAIAARTYAASQGSTIMDDTINFQVYAGYDWHPMSTKAVNETSGQTLMYNGKYIWTVFSSSNGGRTESNASVWGGTAVSYLPIKDDPYDSVDPWSFTINKTQIDLGKLNLKTPETWWDKTKEKDTTIPTNIKSWLSKNGYPHSEIKIVAIPTLTFSDQLTSGGRVKSGDITVRFFARDLSNQFIKNPDGTLKLHTVEFKNTTAQRIRAMIGINLVRSYLVDSVKDTSDGITVSGRGWGHGVGMSQWGAKKMADKGFKVNRILGFYYPNATLTPLVRYEKSVQPTEVNVPLKIKNTRTQYDSKNDQVIVRYALSQNAAVTISIRNSSNKVVATIIKEVNRKAGDLAQYWTVTNIKNDTYSIFIDAKNSKGQVANVRVQYKLEKKLSPNKLTKQPTKATTQLAKHGTQVTGKIKVDVANVRKSATTKSKIVGKAKLNKQVHIMGRTGQFYQVQVGKLKGYIHVDLLTINQKLADKSHIAVVMDGKVARLDDKAVIYNKTVYVPLKGTAEGLKMKYQWNKKNNQITVKDSRNNILLKVNNKATTINKKNVRLTHSPIIKNSKIYVSLKTITETTKAKTYWDTKAKVVWINK